MNTRLPLLRLDSPGARHRYLCASRLIVMLLLTAGSAGAATLTVTNALDSGSGSLRAQIAAAASGDVIDFSPALSAGGPVTITLTTGEIATGKNLTITGPGADKLTISGNSSSRVLHFTSATQSTTLSAVTLANGVNTGGFGGALLSRGNVSVRNCAFVGNQAAAGAAAYMQTVNASFVNCLFTGNIATAQGGAVSFQTTAGTHTLDMMNCTMSGNAVTGAGFSTLQIGAFATGVSQVSVRCCTFADNTTTNALLGEAIVCGSDGATASSLVTLFGNIFKHASSVTLARFSQNGGPPGTYISEGYNLASDNGGTFLTSTGDKINTNPVLGLLASNGGLTQTRALLFGSPAIGGATAGAALRPADTFDLDDDGNTAELLPVDQRGEGFARVSGGLLDVGAFQIQRPAQTTFTNFMDATTVVGQTNFTNQSGTVSQVVMSDPVHSAVSVDGRLAICEQTHSRVLIWNAVPMVNGLAADVVVGKSSFSDTAPGTTASRMANCNGVAFSADGKKLLVSDTSNHRVLIWNTIPTANGAPADVVIGQTDFVSNTSGLSATNLAAPNALCVTPDGRLLVADQGNNRVLIFNSIPTANGAAADVVIGQPDMVTLTTGNAANQFFVPLAMAVSPDGRLLVADMANNRVVVFNSIPVSNGASADVVIGQTGFGTGLPGASPTQLRNPAGVAVSPSGQLAIADNINNRVLLYDTVPTTHGTAANVVLGQPDFTSNTSFNGGISAHSMSSPGQLSFTPAGRLIVPGRSMRRAMIYGAGPAPVSGALGDVITTADAVDAAGTTSIAKYDLLSRGCFLAENGTRAFPGSLQIGSGSPPVTLSPNNFMGLWKDDGGGLKLLARSGDTAPESGGAVFNILPDIPAINDRGQLTAFASLVQGAGTPTTDEGNDIGLWSELGGTGFQILMRENDDIPGLPAGTKIGRFGRGCFATARISVSQGEAVFCIEMKGASTDSALLRASVAGPTVTAVGVIARENTPVPGTGESFGFLNGDYTNAARMDAQGNVAFGAVLEPSGRTSHWYQPRGGALVKTFAAGDNAPDTGGATFQSLDLPCMGSGGTFAFRAVLNQDGDNADNSKNDGIWRGTTLSGFAAILRRGDTNASRPGLNLPGAAAKAGNIYTGWLTNGNRGAWLGWVDLAGDGISAYPADTFGIYTDLSGTMTLLIRSGDAAPGFAGATLFFIDHPIVGGAEQLAFIGTVTGGGTTAGVNDKGIWRSGPNGSLLSLVLRTGGTMNTTVGTKTIADVDLPGSNLADHQWEQPVMDGTGRLIVFVTFTDGSTSEVLVP